MEFPMKYEVWREGYHIQGGDAPTGATKVGEVEANSFREACDKLLLGDSFAYDRVTLTDWGCQLFDNEADARKRFG